MAGRVKEEKVRMGVRGGGNRLMCYMYILSSVVWNCFKSVYCQWSLCKQATAPC